MRISVFAAVVSLIVLGCAGGEGVALYLQETLPDAFIKQTYSVSVVSRTVPPNTPVYCNLFVPQSVPPGAQAGLPPGLSLQTDGTVSGVPTTTGTYCFGVVAQLLTHPRQYKSSTIVRKTYTLNVGGVVFKERLAAAVRDHTYSIPVYSVALPDAASFNWSTQDPAQTNPGETAGLPPGISLQNGVLTGTPTESGLFRFVVEATSGSATYTKEFLLAVRTFEWARKVVGSADTGNSAPRCCATPDGTTYAVWLHDNAGTKQLVYAKKPEQVDATLEDPLSAASADDATACDITAGKDTSLKDAAIIAWLNTAKSLNITYSTDTSTVTHSKNINTSDADIKLLFFNNILYVAYAARGTTSDGISLWQPIADTTETVASGTYNNLTGIGVSTLQRPLLAATDASDAYVFWYDGQQWQSATCPRGQGDTDSRDDVALAAGSGGQVWVFWARGGKIEAALFDPADGTFSDVVSVCDGEWVEAAASAFVDGNVWLLVGFDDGGVIEAKWVTFDGLDVVEKELADYTPPIDSKEVEGAGLGMTSENEVLLVMVVGDEVRWMLWTPHAWSYPQPVTNGWVTERVRRSRIVGWQNGLYVAWQNDGNGVIKGRIWDEQQWSGIEEISEGVSESSNFATLARTSDGSIWAAWGGTDPNDGESYIFVSKRDPVSGWTLQRQLQGDTQNVYRYWPRMRAFGSTVVLVWVERKGGSDPEEVWFCSNSDWNPKVILKDAYHNWGPKCALASTTQIGVAYTQMVIGDASTCEAFLILSQDGGQNWRSGTNISNTSGVRSSYQDIEWLPSGKAFICWDERLSSPQHWQIWGAEYDPATQTVQPFSKPVIASTAGNCGIPDAAVTSDGLLFVSAYLVVGGKYFPVCTHQMRGAVLLDELGSTQEDSVEVTIWGENRAAVVWSVKTKDALDNDIWQIRVSMYR